MTDQHIEEALSISYVSAVVSYTGRSYDTISRDYGVDGAIRQIDRINGRLVDIGTDFKCQLKATVNWSETNNDIIYDMDSNAYNNLVHRNSRSTVPCILILLCLPREKKHWLSIDTHQLAIRQCCYYLRIVGPRTENVSTVRIRIPKQNQFNYQGIEALITDLESN